MAGYTNRVLRVDLSSGTFTEESLDEALIHDYMGGRGFGVKMLYDDLKPGTDPLGEDNELIFIAGPLAGTNAQSFSRYKVFFKSPLTGGYFKTCSGGHMAREIKTAGFDAVIVRGKSDKPVYLWIHDGKYELKDAGYLWGLDCDDTHTLIREEQHDPNIRMGCIGPSGERGVKYAGIFSDRRACGRGGGGAVMGDKKLKAIAFRGSREVELADKAAFAAAVKAQVNEYKNHPQFPIFSKSGTWIAEVTNLMGMYPTKNFQEGFVPDWKEIESAEYLKLLVRKTGCYSCMVHCGSLAKIARGGYGGSWTEGPEYETIWAFTGPMRKADIGLTIAADYLCDRLGLDTISCGSSIGFAYELYDKGLITKKDTGGLELKFGDSKPVLELIRQIAYREGIGDLLAEGTREAARRIGKGSEDYAIQVKGLELPAYDPRGAKAHGLNLMTCAIGADHNSGYAPQEIFGAPIPKEYDRFAWKEKGELTKMNQDMTAYLETGILCSFMPSMGMLSDETYGKLMVAATGVKDFADPDYLHLVGEKIVNLERMFNVREGFGKKDDAFPKRITEESVPEGPGAGQVFEAELMLKDYYEARGWDVKTGIPTGKKLEELGLGFTLKK
jgi:aldehyde:ferredoxin oxidoreductase